MINSKLPNTGVTIFSVLSKVAKDFNAIDLTRAYPDFNCPEKLANLVSKYIQKGFNQYAPMPGVPQLREKISQNHEKLYGAKYDPIDEVTITPGINQAISTTISAFIREGEDVIIFEPSYEVYSAMVKLNGGMPVYVKHTTPDYAIDWDELNKSITARTKMIVLNNPHNITGKILTEADLEKLSRLVGGSKIIILADESFEHIVYGDAKHQSISKFPELAKRSIIISSFGKSFHVNGWNLSYCLAPSDIMKEFRKIHQYQVYAVNTPFQYAIAEFLEQGIDVDAISNFYRKKRDCFNGLLEGSKFLIAPSDATYYQLLDYSEISEDKDNAFATRLTTDCGVAGTPISSFYHDKVNSKVLRFSFAKSDEILKQAAEKLKSAE